MPIEHLMIILILAIILIVLTVRPLRKTCGLLLIIIGFICCLSLIGIVIGIPLIIAGGLLLFV
jgi:hypothetical protein